MENCRTCSTRGADQCAAIWNFDAHVVACLRRGAEIAQRSGVSQISIAHFMTALCHDEAAVNMLSGLGADPRVLEFEMVQLVVSSRQGPGQDRVVLSQSLNALLIAAEQTAQHARRSVVTLDVVIATLMQNAAQDDAAGIFYRHVASRKGQQQVASAGVRRDVRSNLRQDDGLSPRAGARARYAHEGRDVESSRQFRQSHEQSYASKQTQQRAYDVLGSRGATHNAAPSAGAMSRSERHRQTASAHSGSMQTMISDTRTQSTSVASQSTVAREGGVNARGERSQRSNRSDYASTVSLRTPGAAQFKDHAGRREATEHEHYETILRMLRVQEARLERLETDTERTRGRKSSRLRVRKIAPLSLSSRGAKTSKSQTKRQSQSHSGSSGATTRQASQTAANSSDHSGSRSSYGWRERQSSGASSQSSNTHSSRLFENASVRGSRAGQDRRRDSDRDGWRTGSSREPDLRTATQRQTERTDGQKEKRFYLAREDELVEAPSIGPKTAARFTPLGIRTVRDLLELDADTVAAQLKVRHISADVLRDWQDQARLVCTVPWLRGTHAQLLVGADYRSADELAKADLGDVFAGILRFASTNQGERVLRTNPPPEREKVATWLGFAKQSDMSRVA